MQSNNFLCVQELKSKINAVELASDDKCVFTYNQLMKSDRDFKYIFIFDEYSVEVPSLVSFSNHFKISIAKLSSEDVLEIKKKVKYAQLLAIYKETDTRKVERVLDNGKTISLADILYGLDLKRNDK